MPRFRHHLYEWLGADKVELAVMAELLLRGAQTEGELRGRAARMDPIPDLNALRPILASLESKGLIVSLTPAGRGHVLTHALYQPQEMEKLRAQFSSQPTASSQPTGSRPVLAPSSGAAEPVPVEASLVAPPDAMSAAAENRLHEQMTQLREEFGHVRDEVARLRRQMDDLVAQLQ